MITDRQAFISYKKRNRRSVQKEEHRFVCIFFEQITIGSNNHFPLQVMCFCNFSDFKAIFPCNHYQKIIQQQELRQQLPQLEQQQLLLQLS